MKNKRSKEKTRDIDIMGTKFILPKDMRKKLNKEYPELKKKRLNVSHLSRVNQFQKIQEN